MEGMPEFVVKLITPFVYPFLPTTRIYAVHLLGALILALLVYRTMRRDGGLRSDDAISPISRFIRFCLPKSIYGHKSAIVDYKFFVISRLSHAFLLAPILLFAPAISEALQAALSQWLGPSQSSTTPGLAMRGLFTIAAVLAFDLGLFIVHYLQHRVPILWEFHKVHHSAQVITPMTVYRMHPVDDILAGGVTALLVGAVTGAFAYGLAQPIDPLQVAGQNIVLFAYYLLGYNLRHSHIWLAYPKWLGRLLISPAQHQIHHSTSPLHFNKNLGFMFSFWDRFAHSLYVPQEREEIEFGLGGGEDDAYQGVVALYLLPFKKAAALFGGSRGAAK